MDHESRSICSCFHQGLSNNKIVLISFSILCISLCIRQLKRIILGHIGLNRAKLVNWGRGGGGGGEYSYIHRLISFEINFKNNCFQKKLVGQNTNI